MAIAKLNVDHQKDTRMCIQGAILKSEGQIVQTRQSKNHGGVWMNRNIQKLMTQPKNYQEASGDL